MYPIHIYYIYYTYVYAGSISGDIRPHDCKKRAVFVRKMGNLEQNMKKEFCYFCATVNPG